MSIVFDYPRDPDCDPVHNEPARGQCNFVTTRISPGSAVGEMPESDYLARGFIITMGVGSMLFPRE